MRSFKNKVHFPLPHPRLFHTTTVEALHVLSSATKLPKNMETKKTTALLPVVLTLLLLAGCGGGQQPASPPEPGTVSSDTIQGDTSTQNLLKARNTENQWVRDAELSCVKADFTRYVHVGTPTIHSAIQLRALPLTVGVSKLQTLIDALPCANGGAVQHGVLLHYGLDSNMQFDVMLQVVCLSYASEDSKYSYTEPGGGYTLDGTGALVYDAAALAKWYGSNGPGARYASNVVVDHNASNVWTKFSSAKDVRSTIYPFQTQIMGLVNDNKLGPNGLLRIDPISEPIERRRDGAGGYNEVDYHQGAAWVPVGVSLDNTFYPQTPFKNKAADLGSPCPYTCPNTKFKFKFTGLEPREGC